MITILKESTELSEDNSKSTENDVNDESKIDEKIPINDDTLEEITAETDKDALPTTSVTIEL